MKKIYYLIFFCFVFFNTFFAVQVYAVTESPIRSINVVYDDSGSMINTNGNEVDTWCQAKYAMEVFAAMLEDNDTMKVYVLSDFENGTNASERLKLNGTDGAASNVAKVHSMITTARNTSFNAVKKAYSDIVSVSADEKWLVILTDGEFQNIDDMDAYFNSKSDDVKIMFLGMGPAAYPITANESKNIFYEEASSNDQILNKITEISERIFNSHKIEVNTSDKKFSFDVPMKELTVFAQGGSVKINSLQALDGSEIVCSSEPVGVRYSEKSALNHEDGLVDKNLVGSIAIFEGDFDPGEYVANVDNPATIEVYYKPNIEIAAYLKTDDGEEVTDVSDLKAGNYIIEFGLIRAGTDEKVEESLLLGDITYEAVITNNGTTLEGVYASGDKIPLEEGPLSVDITAHYLEYNTVSTHLDYTIYTDKTIEFTAADNPVFTIDRDGTLADGPAMRVKMTLNGNEVTREQWDAMGIPEVKLAGYPGFNINSFDIKKTDEPGIFELTPVLKDGRAGGGTYSDCKVRLSYDGIYNIESWSGSSDIEMKMHDDRTWFERNKIRLIQGMLLLLLIILLLGYVPGIKHYLPRSLKKKPGIDCRPDVAGQIPHDAKGRYEKKLLTTIIPYVAQRGIIKFVPKGVPGIPVLQVKGIRRNRMAVTNARAYAGKSYITFNGDTIEKDDKKRLYETSAGVTISVHKNDWTYNCQPNQTII